MVCVLMQVCLGDRIVVDVKNGMPGKQTTIHWHGIYMKGTPYMDGVPMVTQCSIMSEQTFRYDFTANNSGTYFWHSHEGKCHFQQSPRYLLIKNFKIN